MDPNKVKASKFWEVKQQAGSDVLEIYVYGPIDKYEYDLDTWEIKKKEASQAHFREILEANPDVKEIKLYVNSQGGSVLEAMGMRTLLKRHPAKVTAYVDGWAASAASFLLTAADEVLMDASALQMVHNMWIFAAGNSRELRKMADDLDKMMEGNRKAYLEKSGDKLTEEKLIELMDAETWLTADECLELGLCDKILETKKDEPDPAVLAGSISTAVVSRDALMLEMLERIDKRLSPEPPPDNNIDPEETGNPEKEPENKGSFFMAAMLKAVERTNK